MNKDSLIYVAGHHGLVGSALVRQLRASGYQRLLFRERGELDLTDQSAVRAFFAQQRPEYVVLAAAKVGGIHANATLPAEFIEQNLLIQANVIDAAYRSGARKLLFLGSSCIYPKLAPQPMREDCLLTGSLEPTNEWYAIAKIAGLKTCQAYRRQYGFDAIAAMPTNLYGPGDNFDLESSHVLPALVRKVHEAKRAGAPKVNVWGTGNPRREFLYVDDLAAALIFLLEHYSEEAPINVGTGTDVTIRELAQLIADTIGFRGELQFDPSKPDGSPQKLLDVSRLTRLGWVARTSLSQGIAATYAWYLESATRLRA
jgi:GDP-L-fucose synthase